MMSNPKRLHPISAAVNFLKHLKEMLVPFLVFVVFGSRGGNGEIVQLVLSIGIIAAVFLIGILTWWRYTYRLEEGELRIEYGVLVKKKDIFRLKESKVLTYRKACCKDPLDL